MIYDETNGVIEDNFKFLLNRYQIGLENIILDFVNLLHYKCHKRNLNRGESYILSGA